MENLRLHIYHFPVHTAFYLTIENKQYVLYGTPKATATSNRKYLICVLQFCIFDGMQQKKSG